MKWNQKPVRWGEGAMIGNGLVGAMVYGAETDFGRHVNFAKVNPENNQLMWHIGRTDVYDVQLVGACDTDQYRVPLGKVMIEPYGVDKSFDMELDLHKGEINGQWVTSDDEISFTSFVAANDTIVIKIKSKNQQYAVKYFNDENVPPFHTFVTNDTPYKDISDPAVFTMCDGAMMKTQRLKNGSGYTMILDEEALAQDEKLVRIQLLNYCVEGDCAEPLAELRKIGAKNHNDYSIKSSISVPDKALEEFYNMQMYKLKSACSSLQPIVDLMGPWPGESVWAGVWWNLNVQLTYWPLCKGNCMDLMELFVNEFLAHEDILTDNASEVLGRKVDDQAMIGRATGRNFKSITNTEFANLIWVCHNLVMYAQYKPDKEIIGRIIPLLKKAVNYCLNFVEKREDGKFHVVMGVSPEYPVEAEDTNYHLGLLRWAFKTIEDFEGLNDRMKDVSDNLVDFPVNEDGFMIGKDVPYALSHRHFSHLMMVYPLNVVPYNEKNKELIEKSVKHWLSLDEELQGYSFTIGAAFYARMRNGDKAYEHLKHFMSNFATYNTMYNELGQGGMTMETPLTLASSLQEMLVQVIDGEIVVFPAIPSDWKNVEFSNLRVEGGYEVSARMENGEIVYKEIKEV